MKPALWLLSALFVCAGYADQQRASKIQQLRQMRAQYNRRQAVVAINNCRHMTTERLKHNVASVTSGWQYLPPKWRRYCVSELRRRLGRLGPRERPWCTVVLRRMGAPCNVRRSGGEEECLDKGTPAACAALKAEGSCSVHDVWKKCQKTCEVCPEQVDPDAPIPQPPNCPEEQQWPIAGSDCGWGGPAECPARDPNRPTPTPTAAGAGGGASWSSTEPPVPEVLSYEQLSQPTARLLACGSRLAWHVQRTCRATFGRLDLCDNVDYNEKRDIVDTCCKNHCEQLFIINLCCIMNTL